MTLTLHRDVPPLLGLVMVGGKSSRMQRAKAHLVIHDVPQWHYCETVLRSVVDDVYFSVSPQLSPPLTTRSDRLIEDCFREPIGPLGGIISAFRRFPDHALFVLACDLPYFVAAAAEYLVAMRNDRRLASVFTDEKGLVEPLCGIYEPAIKTELARAWAENRFCPRGILSNLDVKKVATHQNKHG
jgi:molybdopterin-guanine dinucleotide biosynthesis protein A